MSPELYEFLDFFAGSGLVTEGVKPYFHTAWANDISPKKAEVYLANQDPYSFYLGPLQNFSGQNLPQADVSWASFPCQDLSLAGKQQGINGNRSGLVWTWLKIMDEMPTRPPIVVVENVSGLTSTSRGNNYRTLHQALTGRNYQVGPLQLDALRWLPQSRKRIFVLGVRTDVNLDGLTDDAPNWLHPEALRRAVDGLTEVIWWSLQTPPPRTLKLSDVIEYDAPLHTSEQTKKLLALIPPKHMAKLKQALTQGLRVFPGYKRIRGKKQVLEIRTDDISGCLRTANGGSSREFIVISVNGELKTRLLTVREAARLMGLPDSYSIPGDYNSGYNAMGDAVALPVTRFLTEHLLLPLARRAHADNPRVFTKIQEAIR
ncbi:MAG: DNA cytosine methyltransferase [Dehalococcoidia bacterium]|jgi:DNA (cytosine-5)-methyltransferase 1